MMVVRTTVVQSCLPRCTYHTHTSKNRKDFERIYYPDDLDPRLPSKYILRALERAQDTP